MLSGRGEVKRRRHCPNRVSRESVPLFRIKRRKDLCRILNISLQDLRSLTDQSMYAVKDVLTKKGKVRHTETPVKSLRAVHERLTRLLMSIQPPDYLFCPVKGRSQIDNALRHRNAGVICTLDIKNYFPSTPASKVAWFFLTRMECAPDVSAILAKIICRNGRLPTGSPLSSIAAFYAFSEMWDHISAIALKYGCVLTVYMDDLTISGPKVSGEALWEIKQAIHRAGLQYHKEHVYRAQPAIVTGVVIRDGKLLLPNRQHRKCHDTRQLVSSDTDNLEEHHRRLAGLMAYRQQIQKAAMLSHDSTDSAK